jgi:hypothetical protein
MQATATLPTSLSGNDFSDWLSPILVKELRQGLKSRAFVATFIVVQVVMILLVGMELLTFAGGGGRGALDTFDGFFWAFVWLPLLVMMPARGLTTVSEEMKANTLDLVQLTRLTAFRIVLGKWIALVSQTLLLVAAILPYAVLRYFFGEVDVVDDVRNIAVLLMVSVCLTAGAIALSSVNLAVRIIVLVVLLPMLVTGIIPMMFMRAMGGSSSFGSMFDFTWMGPVFMTVYTYLMLEIAAARIAPLSENHAAPKRLLALALGAGGILVAALFDEDKAMVWVSASSLACGWVILEALCERTVPVPSLYHSFARRGALGRLMGRVLYPGWASGLLFFGLLMLMLAAVFAIAMSTHASAPAEEFSAKATLMFPIACTAVVAPVAVLLFFPRVRQPMWLYVLVQAICALLFLIASIIQGSTHSMELGDAFRWLAPFPTSALFALFNEPDNEELRSFFSMVSLPICAAIVGYLAIRALREFREIGELERESLGKNPSA